MTIRSYVAAAGIALSLCAGAAIAREAQPQGTPKAIADIYACRSITDAAQRLACFDSAAGVLAKAESDKEIVFADRAQMREARKGLFGFSLPKLKLFGNDGDSAEEPEEFQTLSSTIARTGQYKPGRWFFVLPDGARWQQIDTQEVIVEPKAGEPIVIRKAALGSYMAKVSGRNALRVNRVE